METIQTQINIPIQFKELFNPKWRNLVYYGGRSGGKSRAVAESLLLRGRQNKLRILATREIQNTIKDSVLKLLADLIEQYGFDDYEVQRDTILNKVTGTEFIFKGLRLNINEIKSTEGIDVCWVEEAQAVTDKSLDILAPTIRKPGSQLIFTFNRMAELDPVYVRYVMNQPPSTFVKKVNYDVLETLGLLPDVIKLEIDADRDNPSIYAHKWLGEPLGQAEMSIIPRDSILEAMKRHADNDGAWEVGVDVARFGSDRTVFAARKGMRAIDEKIMQGLRTTQICDELERFVRYEKKLKKDKPNPDAPTLKIDDTGVGGGVTDEMVKRGYNVIAINFGGEPLDKDKYPNWISEAWFHMAEVMPTISLPFNSDLLMELSTRQWKQDNNGRRRVEGKQEYKKRGFRSPDIADAYILAYSLAKQKASNILW